MRVADRSRLTGSRQDVRSCIAGLALRSKFWIEVDGQFAIGEGGCQLLNEVNAKGSLAGAARQVGWSYRHAWGYLKRAEQVLGVALTTTRPGKGRTRGATLTSEAQALVGLVLRKQR
jgi:molybdate transport system regulatory protein